MIGFLHPWVLAGLAAAAIPLLLHLLARREPPTVVFPAVRYLVTTTREHQRRLKLQNLLLLLLRTLLVVTLVMAAAGPTVPLSGVPGHAPSALVLIVDNSPSSGTMVGGSPQLSQLVAAGRNVLARATPDDALWLIAADGIPRRGDAAALRELLDRLTVSPRRLPLGDALTLAGEVLAAESRPGEIVLLTDLQATALSAAQLSAPLLVGRPSAPPPRNTGIGQLQVGTQPWQSGGGRISLVLVGDSSGSVPVSARLGARPPRQALGRAGGAVTLAIPGAPSGWWTLTAALDPDEFRPDDRRVAAIRIAPVARVSWDSTSRFLAAASEVLVSNGRILPGREVTLGRLAPGASVVQPPSDPAALGALNRALAGRGLVWKYANAATDVAFSDSGALVGRHRIARRYALESTTSGRTGVLATVNGAPWIVRDGNVILLGSRLEPAWTDLPTSAAFMPFMDVVLNRLARGEAALGQAAPGDPVPLPDQVNLVRQGEQEWRVEGGGLFQPPESGVFYLLTGPDTVGAISVNPDPRESQLTRAGDAEARQLWKGARLASLDDVGDDAFSSASRGDLRGPLLWLALIAGLVEVGLAGFLAPPMTLKPVLDAFARAPAVQDLAERIPARHQTLNLSGLPGSSGAVLAAWLAENHPQRLLTVVAPTAADAERWLSDLAHLTDAPTALYPQREALGEDEPHYEIAGERAEAIQALLQGRLRILVTTARATAERTLLPEALERMRLHLARGARRPPTEVARALESMGYRRVPTVTEVAEFSVRGGILDVYGFGMASPARLEWWGDDISSLRGFDLTTQRSLEELSDVTVLPVSTSAIREELEGGNEGTRETPSVPSLLSSRVPPVRRTLFERFLPSDTLVIEEAFGPKHLDEVTRAWDEAEHHLEVARRLGEDVPSREAIFAAPADWRSSIEAFPRLLLRGDRPDLQLGFFPPDRVDRDLNRLRSLLGGEPPTLILCDNEGQLERMEELLEDGARSRTGATLAIGALDGGFVMPGLRVLTDHEIFRRARRLRRARRYRQAAPSAATGALTLGDYVVHLEHGIGVYRGIQTITVGESTLEVAIVEYEGGDRLNVPLYRLDQLERYRAAGEDGDRPPPRIHRLGGSSWQKVREKTRQAIKQMAAELLDLYARRKVSGGYPFPPDTKWQRELESSFLYEDTPDQRKATEELKRDMEQPRPMDRLLVGDVGYGKTEIAVRAAFKAVQGGKQVAVLVPTTILAEQHGRTFIERLADFPVKIEVLSRFRTAKEQRAVLARLASGEIDVVIGTHRLLSKDVVFKDLGLLVVDEEHRFGVKHKERLKAMRLAVDVLTLTATPIPRTLHLSLAGLRDLTLIETPPRDRSPILTFVEPWDDPLLEEAFAREIDRGGQVFAVHNRIETIDTIAAKVQALSPRARVGVAHGQMAADELEDVMRRFVAGEVDILVSTMIVESGLDVPNANTMVVHDAHRFGLAQLYQLRGRVGRSHRRAYCYLLVPDTMDADAEDRLKVLEHHTDLGAGYRIALKDLELRGAGNLLGAEQSGHAQAVGFDLYMRWLEETVRALRGQGTVEQPAPPDVVLDRPAHLPDGYVPDDDVKLDLYRRLARAGESGEIDGLRDELRERFGPLPETAENLLDMARLRVMGAALGLQNVLVRGDEARITFRPGTTPRLAGLTSALDDVQLAAEVRRTVPLSLRLTRLGGEPLVPALVRALRKAL